MLAARAPPVPLGPSGEAPNAAPLPPAPRPLPPSSPPHFVQSFNTSYKRVNKARQRNLRCFPAHSPLGHAAAGFCGCPVVMFAPAGVAETDWLYFGELALASTPPRTSVLSFESAATTQPLLRGERMGDAIVFNQGQVWRYDWVSNFATCHTLHVVRVYLASPNGAVVWYKDSPAFVVSSFRNKNVEEELGVYSPTDPLRIVIKAVRDRVRSVDLDSLVDTARNSEEEEAEEEPFGIDDENMLETGSFGAPQNDFTMDVDSTATLLEIETLDAVLIRCAGFIMDHFSKWRDSKALKRDLELYFAREGLSLEDVASRCKTVFGLEPQLSNAVLANSLLSSRDLLGVARKLALEHLPQGAALLDEIDADMLRDLTGCYRRPEAYDAYLHGVQARQAQWASVDLSLLERNVPHVLYLAVSPRKLIKVYRGPGCWGKNVMFEVNAVNRPQSFRPLDFRAAPNDFAMCVWPFRSKDQRGMITLVFGEFDGALAQIFVRAERGNLLCYVFPILRNSASGHYQGERPWQTFLFEAANYAETCA